MIVLDTNVLSEGDKPHDVRWRQRFQNYRLALARLSAAVALSRERALSELEQQGLVQAFEFTHELAWNVLKDYLEAQGSVDVIGSKNATRQAFKNGLIEDGESWMDMIRARNLTSHTFQAEVVEEIGRAILARYHPALVALERRFTDVERREGEAT